MCIIDQTNLPSDTRSFSKQKFKKYKIKYSKSDNPHYLFELKMKFGKKFKIYDALIVTMPRHLFQSSQTFEFIEK